MPCRWKAGTWTAVIVAIVAAISAGPNRDEPQTPVVTIAEGVR